MLRAQSGSPSRSPSRVTIDVHSISAQASPASRGRRPYRARARAANRAIAGRYRSEEHTSELQSRGQLVCRLLLEKKKLIIQIITKLNITCIQQNINR